MVGLIDDEKSIFIPFIPFWLILDLNTRNRVMSTVFNATVHFSLVSPFDSTIETVIKSLIIFSHLFFSLRSLRKLNRSSSKRHFNLVSIIYLFILAMLHLSMIFKAVLFDEATLPQIKFLCTLLCSLGLSVVWLRLYFSFLNNKWK